MISIVISSADVKLLKEVKINIERTIGIKDYEVLSYDNSNGGAGICEVYNRGIRDAKFDIVCFMHEDLAFNTDNWGLKVLELFKNNHIGLLGVGGSTYRSKVPSGWCPPPVFGTDFWRLNVNQKFKYKQDTERHDYFNPKQEKLARVACVDGLWFCTTKELALKCMFDNELLKGFHGYDIDFSLAIGQYAPVYVTFDILMTHFSEGNFNHKWLADLIRINQKWEHILPINFSDIEEEILLEKEKRALKEFLSGTISDRNITFSQKSYLLWNCYCKKQLSLSRFIKFYIKLLKKGSLIN